MRVWRDSLRMQRRAGHNVEVPLSQLPTNDWQRISPAVLVPAEAFRVTRGQLRYHFTPSAAGGQHKRGFCAECGSLPTGGENTERPTDVVGVTAGSLDDPSLFQPQMDIFVSDAQTWDQMDPTIPKFEQYPPSAKE